MSSLGGFNLCDFPAAWPPPGQSSNFINPQSGKGVTITICVIMMVAVIVFTVGRLFANRQKLGWSDAACFAALVCTLGHAAIILAQVKYARHQWDIPACWVSGSYAKLIFSQQVFYAVSMFCSKASIFLLFARIFTIGRYMRLGIWLGLVASFAVYFPSIPVEAYYNAPGVGQSWDDLMLSGKPNKAIYWGLVQSSLGILLDSYIFILPLPTITKLAMSLRDRIKAVAVFSTASTAIVASIVSLVYRVLEYKYQTTDGTWYLWPILTCTVVENSVAIIVCSSPGFSKFLRFYVFKWGPVKEFRSRLSSWLTRSPTSSSGSGKAETASPANPPLGGGNSGNSDGNNNCRNTLQAPRAGRARLPAHHDGYIELDDAQLWRSTNTGDIETGLSCWEGKKQEDEEWVKKSGGDNSGGSGGSGDNGDSGGGGGQNRCGTDLVPRASSGEFFILQGFPALA